MARPFKYTPEKLEAKIEEYFKKKEKESREKKLVFCSIRDLASFLKLTCRHSITMILTLVIRLLQKRPRTESLPCGKNSFSSLAGIHRVPSFI